MTKKKPAGAAKKPKARKKKKQSKFSAFVLIAAIFLVGVFVYKMRTAGAPAPKAPAKTVLGSGIAYASKNISENDPAGKYTVDVAYPVFSGFTGFKAQGLANGYVVAQADSFIGDFKDNLSQAVDMPAAEASTLTGTFAVHEEAHHIVSVTFSVSEYESGMAHPNNYEDTENYSTLTGSKVALKDLFIPDSDYLTLIADQANPILDKKLTDAGFKDWFREGAKPTADNYDDFFLTATGLDIIFNPYQVAPYVMGAVTIEIPFDAFGAKLVLPQ